MHTPIENRTTDQQDIKAQFPMKQIIDREGKLVDEAYRNEIELDACRQFYRQMLCMRTFDQKAINLQRQGRIGTYPGFKGQEAAQVGSAMALREDDWMFPTYRDHAASITFGGSYAILSSWKGRIEGNRPPTGRNIVPPSVPIATQLPLATGAAMASKYRQSSQAAIAYFGDGATSEGDFHEGMNFASVFRAPVVFFNQNNRYAISVPVWKQMNSETIAQKALAYGMPGVRVDGNDVFAVHHETMKALERARNGEGPTLIEAVTWRYGAHTTADDPTKYRDNEAENKKNLLNDPLSRLEAFMKAEGYWDDQWAEDIEKDIKSEIDAAVKEMEAMPEPDVNDIYDHMFDTPTWPIEEQKRAYMEYLKGGAEK